MIAKKAMEASSGVDPITGKWEEQKDSRFRN